MKKKFFPKHFFCSFPFSAHEKAVFAIWVPSVVYGTNYNAKEQFGPVQFLLMRRMWGYNFFFIRIKAIRGRGVSYWYLQLSWSKNKTKTTSKRRRASTWFCRSLLSVRSIPFLDVLGNIFYVKFTFKKWKVHILVIEPHVPQSYILVPPDPAK